MSANLIPWTEVGMFWATVGVALITVAATVVNYLFYRTQRDPDVLVSASHDERRPTIIVLTIENVGKSMARNITFRPSRDIPAKAYGFGDAPTPEKMVSGPLINGIPALGPGAKRIISWGQFSGLNKGIQGDAIEIEVRFESDWRLNFLGPRKYRNKCFIDVKSFEDTDASDHNWDQKAAEALKRIASSLEGLSSGSKTVRIEIVDPNDTHN